MLFKKIFSVVLAGAVALSAETGFSAFSRGYAEDGVEIFTESVSKQYYSAGDKAAQDGLLFTRLEDGSYEVGYDYNGSKPSGTVTIPATFNGAAVTRIASAGFAYCYNISDVIVPDSVTSAGSDAFYETTFLKRQNGPIRYAGNIAVHCDSDADSVTVRDGTKGLADKLFTKVKSITSVTLPASLENLGNMTFSGCSGLQSVNIPANVSIIPSGLFQGCSSLRNISIPETVTEIGAYAFADSGITSITLPNVKKIGKGAFENSSLNPDSVHLHNGYIDIGARAFHGTTFFNVQGNAKYAGNVLISCSEYTTSADIGYGTTAIADGTFTGCGILSSVTIPGSVKSIGEDAFFGCSSLTSVAIPEGVERIGEDAFRLCESLTSVSIPKSVKTIEQGAFYGSSLNNVNYAGSVSDWAYGMAIDGENDPLLAVQTTCGGSPSKPSAPTGLRVDNTGPDSVSLSWDKSPLANRYEINVYKDGGWKYAGETTDSSFVVGNLSMGTSYDFKVFPFARNVYGSSARISATTSVGSVSGVSASSTSNSITVSWQAAYDADYYQLDIYKDGQWKYIGQTTGTSLTASDLSQNTTYDLRIFKFKNGHYSPSTRLSFATQKVASVTGLSASPSTYGVQLSWNPVGGADSYQVDVYLNGRWTYVSNSSDTYCNATDLSPNTSYEFRVFTFQGNQYSSSAKITASTLSDAPQTVTGLSASPSNDSITLNWNAGANADSYQVDVYLNGRWTYVQKSAAQSCVISGLSSNTSYDFRVFSFKGSEYSSSARITAATISYAPATVTNLSAARKDNSITLSWTPSPNSDSYQVDVYLNGRWTYVSKSSATSCEITGLASNTSYDFRVFSFRGSEYSPSAKLTVSTLAPGSPTTVTGLTAQGFGSSVTLSWNYSPSADRYQVDVYKNGAWTYAGTTTGNSFTVSGLSPSTAYDFKVFSFRDNDYSSSARITASSGSVSRNFYASIGLRAAVLGLSETNVMMRGIDVSGWQGEIDFKKVKSSGVDFVIIKAGEATSINSYWEKNYKAAKDAGLKVGAYWFGRAVTIDEGKAEARAFIQALKGKKLDFPVYYDLETQEQLSQGESFCTRLVEAFCGELENAGYLAGVYCSTYWFTSCVSDNVRIKRPAWIADYRSGCYYYGDYGMWQYGQGSQSGIDGDCDQNFGYVDYSKYIISHGLNGF